MTFSSLDLNLLLDLLPGKHVENVMMRCFNSATWHVGQLVSCTTAPNRCHSIAVVTAGRPDVGASVVLKVFGQRHVGLAGYDVARVLM